MNPPVKRKRGRPPKKQAPPPPAVKKVAAKKVPAKKAVVKKAAAKRGRPKKVVENKPVESRGHSFIVYDDLEFWAKNTGREPFTSALDKVREFRKKKIEPKVYWDKQQIIVDAETR